MLKSTLNSIHTLCYLNGLVESIKIVIKNNSLSIAFSSDLDPSFTGRLECPNYYGVKDTTLCIYNTSQFLKLIKILDQSIDIKVQEERGVPIKLLISDNRFDLEYYLADENMIKNKPPKIKEPVYELDTIIFPDDLDKFYDAKKALGDVNSFEISFKNKKLDFVIGEGSFSNKIKFSVDTLKEGEIIPVMSFSAKVFNEIVSANDNFDTCSLKISKEGLINISFMKGDLASSYFLVKLDR